MAYWKKIKNTNAVPVLKDELVFDQTPTVNSTNPVTSDGVARAIAGASGEVPVVTENDNGKVLKAIYDAGGPAVEWDEATVDQTYDATSTNAQSGVAVAEAIAAIPSASYTAGDGIDITANEVSVKAGNGLSIGDITSSGTLTMASTHLTGDDTAKYVGDLCTLTSDLLSQITNGGLSVTTSTWFNLMTPAYASTAVYAAICNFDDARSDEFGSNLIYKQYVMGAVSYAYDGVNVIDQNTGVTFDSADYQSSLSNLTLQEIQANPSNYYLAIIQRCPAFDEAVGHTAYFSMWKQVWRSNYGTPEPTSYNTATYTGTVTIQDALNVSNPLPASAVGDAGKVLTVDAAGAAAWATPSGGGGSGVVELITVTSTAASNAQSLYNQVNSAVTNGKIPVLFTSNSSNSRLMRYWYLHRTNSWDTSDKYYVFRSIDTHFDQSTSKYSYVANEMNVGTGGGSNYVIDCYTIAVASGLTWATLDPFTA